jgi:hypothetical protein
VQHGVSDAPPRSELEQRPARGAATAWFAADSLVEQAGFEPSVPHLIGGVRRAIGKAADKLREAPDAGTCVAESSFFEPSEHAPSAARDPGRKKLQPPGRLAPRFTKIYRE